MSTPTPRPALKKAADAHIHPAAPSGSHHLRHASDAPAVPAPRPGSDAEPQPTAPAPAQPVPAGSAPSGSVPRTVAGHRLSGPLRGTTSDSLRAAAKDARRRSRRAAESTVELTVKVPKSLRKEFRAALKADKKDADQVVTALLRAWLNG